MKRRKPDPERAGRDNPRWNAASFRRARPAAEVLPQVLPEAAAEKLLRPRGRPKTGTARVAISLRLPPETLARWKATGPGWQTRMVEKLRKAV